MSVQSIAGSQPQWRQRFNRQAWRRGLVATTFVGLAIAAGLLLLSPLSTANGVPWALPLMAVPLILSLALAGLSSWLWTGSLAVELVDERKQLVRQRTRLLNELKARRVEGRRPTLQEHERMLLTGKSFDVDERLRMIRDRAYRRAYNVIVFVAGIATLYWVAARTSAFGLGLRLPVTLLEQAVVIALFTTFLTALPKAIVAWTEPDLPDEPQT